jgi:hypothetical protein
MNTKLKQTVKKTLTRLKSAEPPEKKIVTQLSKMSSFLEKFLDNGIIIRRKNHIIRHGTRDFAKSPNSKKRAATNLYVKLNQFKETLENLSQHEANIRTYVQFQSEQMLLLHKVDKVDELPSRDLRAFKDATSFTLKDTLKQLEIILAKIKVMYLLFPLKDSEKSRNNLYMALYSLKNDLNRKAGDLWGFINMINELIKDLQGL